jgi:hypothetical protein
MTVLEGFVARISMYAVPSGVRKMAASVGPMSFSCDGSRSSFILISSREIADSGATNARSAAAVYEA